MTEAHTTPMLTPTYNTVLITSILDIVKALNNDEHMKAFDCIETLWVISPKRVRTDCEKEYKQYHHKLAQILSTNGVDAIHSLQLQNREAKRFIATQVRPLLRAIRDSLDEGKYLEVEYGAKPKFGKKGHLKVPT